MSNCDLDFVTNCGRLGVSCTTRTCDIANFLIDDDLRKFSTLFTTQTSHFSTLCLQLYREIFTHKNKIFREINRQRKNFHLHLNLNPRLEQIWWRTEEKLLSNFFIFNFLTRKTAAFLQLTLLLLNTILTYSEHTRNQRRLVDFTRPTTRRLAVSCHPHHITQLAFPDFSSSSSSSVDRRERWKTEN